MNAAGPAYLPSLSGEIIAPAVVFAGPTGVWRGFRDGMGCALGIALGRRLCRSTVVAFDASPRTATLAPGSLSENNEQWSNKIAVTPTRERMPWTSGCR